MEQSTRSAPVKSTRVSSSRVKDQIDPWKRLNPFFEDIIKKAEEMPTEHIVRDIYMGISTNYGDDPQNWPKKIFEFYGKINIKFKDPESTTPLEKRRKAIISQIKNIWLRQHTGCKFSKRK